MSNHYIYIYISKIYSKKVKKKPSNSNTQNNQCTYLTDTIPFQVYRIIKR